MDASTPRDHSGPAPELPPRPGAPANGSLDRLTRLAARLLDAPAAVVASAAGPGDPVQVRSAWGIDPADAGGARAFYALPTRGEAGALVVPDASLDARFADAPLVAGPPHFRSGVGVALPSGGVLCVFDPRPGRFSTADAAALADLAALAAGTPVPTEGENPYRSLVENAVEGIYQSLPDGPFLSVNPALAQLLGYPSPEALLAAVTNPADLYVRPERRAEFDARVRAEEALTGFESEVRRADGTCFWISEHARAIRGPDGEVLRYEGTFEDITARKTEEETLQRSREELEERVRERTGELALLNVTLRQHILERESAEAASRRSESKFRALIENAQDLISVLTPDGISLYQSPSVEHILGYGADDLIGLNIFDELLHPDDRAAVLRASERIVENGEHYVRMEARYLHSDNSWRLLESVSSSTPPDSPVVGLVVNSRDITERRGTERAHEARTREQTAMAELGRFALDGRPLAEILDRAAELVARALQVPFVTINELLPGGKELLVRAGVGWREGVVGQARVPDWRSHRPGPAAAEDSLFVADLRESICYRSVLEAAGGPEPRSAVSVVVYCSGQRFGTLCALSPEPGRFGAPDAAFLQTVAGLLSAVIESERHEAASREVQARYERIAANTPGMVYQAIRHPDGTGSLPFVSEGCRQLYGLEPAQLRARPELMNELIHPEDQPRVNALLAASNAALTPLEWDGRLVQASGEVRWITVRSRPERLPNGDIFRDGVVLDVTELKHAQENMRAAKEEAERANRAKSEFLSRISHELRTPLNAILGFGQLLELESLTPVQGSSVEQILKGGRHLLELVNEVLDITRSESGIMELSPEPVDVTAVLGEALRFIRPLAEQGQVGFDQPPAAGQPTVLADRGRLHQVLLNLLSNAVKYNRPGGRVSVACSRPDERTVRLAITDTGPGLTPEEVARLFTPFERLGAPGRGIEGTGIGLTISRSLVEAMGGTVGVESVPGEGSTFYIDLPAAPADAPPPPEEPPPLPEPAAAASANVRTVLLIDDQDANVSLIERVLETTRPDLRLFTAADGRSGLTLARQQPPDLILLDLHLPDIAGDEVMRRLRNEARTRDVPVVVVSADATPAQITRLRQLGVREYLTKPFRIRELLEAIDTGLAPAQPPPAAGP